MTVSIGFGKCFRVVHWRRIPVADIAHNFVASLDRFIVLPPFRVVKLCQLVGRLHGRVHIPEEVFLLDPALFRDAELRLRGKAKCRRKLVRYC